MCRNQLIIALVITLALPVSAQHLNVLQGVVVDSANGNPIVGASILVEGTTTGTYTRTGGTFRLPVPKDRTTIIVRSVGYKQRRLNIELAPSQWRIALEGASIGLSGATVVANITPEEIVRRTIDRKKANSARIESIVSSLYTKLNMGYDIGMLSKSGPNDAITETFSTVYDRRLPERRKHIRIEKRRQTANVSAQDNMAVFDEFFDFMQDELKLFNTRLVTPLASNALDEYKYTLVDRKPLGDQMVYEISFEPKNRLFPGFEGSLTIIEGTYHLIAASFKPTDESAFPFLKGLSISQRYERVNDSIWAPTFQSIQASGKVRVLAGIIEVVGSISALTHVAEVQVNVPIADSLLTPPSDTVKAMETQSGNARIRVNRRSTSISVVPDADSSRTEFWEEHAFAEPSEQEREIYRKQDSIALVEKDSSETKIQNPRGLGLGSLFGGDLGFANYGLEPLIGKTSITDWFFGGGISLTGSDLNLGLRAAFGSSGTQIGSASLSWNVYKSKDLQVKLKGAVFSVPQTIQTNKNVERQTLGIDVANLAYVNRFDFFRSDGYKIATELSHSRVSLNVAYSEVRHLSRPVLSAPDRVSIGVEAGAWRIVDGLLAVGENRVQDDLSGRAWPLRGRIHMRFGSSVSEAREFTSLMATVSSSLATFNTGYQPMMLDLEVSAGLASSGTPIQYQFGTMRRFEIFGESTDLATLPVNAFGGTSIIQVHAEHNFSDLWWRALGLPTYNGRGLDLIGIGNALSVVQRSSSSLPPGVYGSTNGWYGEAGFGLSRIPTFISDLFVLRFDALWPVGPYATRGYFGWALTLSSPLL